MIVNVVGMGLIGGSFCRAIKQYTPYICCGTDKNEEVLREAAAEEAIDYVCDDYSKADLTIFCLYPEGIVEEITKHADEFKKGSIVIDACGIKSYVVSGVYDLLKARGVTFIGAHPMAGREFSGFAFSLADMFENAFFIMTPVDGTPKEAVETVREFAKSLRFREVVITTPEEHDRIIAYTSQLAHVVSSAYIKSPSQKRERGFSAGSFKDMTRVAKLNEDMWTSLFLLNRQPLIEEIDSLILHLQEYRDSLAEEDADRLHELLKDGRILKEESLKRL